MVNRAIVQALTLLCLGFALSHWASCAVPGAFLEGVALSASALGIGH